MRDNYYVYFVSDGKLMFERTTGTKERAKERCKELRTRDGVSDAFYTLNRVIKGAYV